MDEFPVAQGILKLAILQMAQLVQSASLRGIN
jgi:hypothetical protein